MTALIVDDAVASHNNLNRLLAQHHPEVEVVGSAYSVSDGVALIEQFAPQLLFLDVELPDGTGFDLLQQTRPGDTQVIFISTFDKYAVRAFDFAAVGFLQKPFQGDKLALAMVRANFYQTQRNLLQRYEDIIRIQSAIERKNLPTQLAVTNAKGLHLVPINEIEWIGVDDSLVEIHRVDRKILHASDSLNSYVAKLKPYPQFVRVSARCPLINTQHISRIENDEVYFRSGKTVVLPKGKGKLLGGPLGA